MIHRYVVAGKKSIGSRRRCDLLDNILQGFNVGILKFGQIGLDIVVEIDLKVEVTWRILSAVGMERTLTTVNSDSFGYPRVVP